MGYNIEIGEAEIVYYPEEELDECSVRIGCSGIQLDNAPDLGHGDISGKGNGRYPSYTTWSNFCKEVGIYDVFYKPDDLRRAFGNKEAVDFRNQHPGAIPLIPYHLERIKKAKSEWITAHPNAICPSQVPCPNPKLYECQCEVDWPLGRLNWLEFWMDWALNNCKQPVIANS